MSLLWMCPTVKGMLTSKRETVNKHLRLDSTPVITSDLIIFTGIAWRRRGSLLIAYNLLLA